MENDNMQALITAIQAGTRPENLLTTPAAQVWMLPGGGDIAPVTQVVEVERWGAKPLRKRGTVTVFDAASFNQVLSDNKDAGDVAIYIDRNPEKPLVTAILNGNGKAGPGWNDFRANIEFRPTPQWLKWMKINGTMMPQLAFAEFIEDNAEDVADPSGAAMLEIATYLEATRSVNFKSGLRLPSGQIQLTNIENVEAKVGAAQTLIPEIFTLGIAPIVGLAPYKVPVRFRYRINDGKLLLGIKLQRVEDLMRQVVEDVIAKIEKGANVSVMDGLPPTPTGKL